MHAEVVSEHPVLEELFAGDEADFGSDYDGYRNHCYRVFNCCRCLLASDVAAAVIDEEIAIAAFFHDVGIWTDATFDYLAPSIDRAAAYLERTGRRESIARVTQMISEHHKVRRYSSSDGALVEAFRRADWLDVVWIGPRHGLDAAFVRELRRRFPDAGFHWRLVQLGLARLRSHPTSPLPMMKW